MKNIKLQVSKTTFINRQRETLVVIIYFSNETSTYFCNINNLTIRDKYYLEVYRSLLKNTKALGFRRQKHQVETWKNQY